MCVCVCVCVCVRVLWRLSEKEGRMDGWVWNGGNGEEKWKKEVRGCMCFYLRNGGGGVCVY